MLDSDERSASESLHSAHRVDRIPLRSVESSAAAYTVAHAVARPQIVVTPCGDKHQIPLLKRFGAGVPQSLFWGPMRGRLPIARSAQASEGLFLVQIDCPFCGR